MATSYEHLDTKLDSIIAKLGAVGEDVAMLKVTAKNNCENIGKLAESVAKQNGRVSKLEQWRAKVLGIATAAGVGASAVFKWLIN